MKHDDDGRARVGAAELVLSSIAAVAVIAFIAIAAIVGRPAVDREPDLDRVGRSRAADASVAGDLDAQVVVPDGWVVRRQGDDALTVSTPDGGAHRAARDAPRTMPRRCVAASGDGTLRSEVLASGLSVVHADTAPRSVVAAIVRGRRRHRHGLRGGRRVADARGVSAGTGPAARRHRAVRARRASGAPLAAVATLAVVGCAPSRRHRVGTPGVAGIARDGRRRSPGAGRRGRFQRSRAAAPAQRRRRRAGAVRLPARRGRVGIRLQRRGRRGRPAGDPHAGGGDRRGLRA